MRTRRRPAPADGGAEWIEDKNSGGAACKKAGGEGGAAAGSAPLVPLPRLTLEEARNYLRGALEGYPVVDRLPLALPAPGVYFDARDPRNDWKRLFALTDEELESRLLAHRQATGWFYEDSTGLPYEQWRAMEKGAEEVEERLLKLIAVRWVELRKKGVRQ